MSAEVLHGDCVELMRAMPDNSVDSIVTDPPYGLGFMGKAWDALPPGEEWARECLRVLKPGGYLLAFGGTRTWHRLAVAIEDAGFELRDSIAWMHGQGFPKGNGNLKPAFEPVVVAMKRRGGSTSGLMNVKENLTGLRHPANVVLDEYSAGVLDEQSGPLHTQDPTTRYRPQDPAWSPSGTARGTHNKATQATGGLDEKGAGASRFFYVAKPSKKERPVANGVAHATVKPLKLMRHLVRLVTPGGGTVLDTFAGSGTTVEACILEGFDCIAIEREADYLPLIEQRIERCGLL